MKKNNTENGISYCNCCTLSLRCPTTRRRRYIRQDCNNRKWCTFPPTHTCRVACKSRDRDAFAVCGATRLIERTTSVLVSFFSRLMYFRKWISSTFVSVNFVQLCSDILFDLRIFIYLIIIFFNLNTSPRVDLDTIRIRWLPLLKVLRRFPKYPH